MNVIGDVAGRTCILQDDIIDTAGTIRRRPGAEGQRAPSACWRARCTACCRGRRSSGSRQSPIDRLIVTNTIPLNSERRGAAAGRSSVLSVARLLGQAIRSIHEETSVSSLFV
jgi:ribose-phosphate pyrophosphokinase